MKKLIILSSSASPHILATFAGTCIVDCIELFFLIFVFLSSVKFSVADVGVILKKLKGITEPRSREIRQMFAATDPEHTKVIEYDSFR